MNQGTRSLHLQSGYSPRNRIPRLPDSPDYAGDRRLFTLLELIIAAAIMLLLLTMLFATAAAITASWERMNAEKNHFMTLMSLDRTFDTMLSNVTPFRWRDAENNPVSSFQGAPERVAFVYRHRLNTVQDGSLRNVMLLVEDDVLHAIYQPRPLLDLDKNPGPNAETTILARGIERIELQYADWNERQELIWTTDWNFLEPRSGAPPGVRVDVFWKNGYQESWVRRTAGCGFDEQLGSWKSTD